MTMELLAWKYDIGDGGDLRGSCVGHWRGKSICLDSVGAGGG